MRDRHVHFALPVRVVLLLLLLVSLLAPLLVAGCGSAAVEAGGTSATPVKGGVLAIAGQPNTLDPAHYTLADDAMVDHCIYETLFAYGAGPGRTGTALEPGLAAKMPEVSEDGKTYRITLRDGSRFAPPVDRAVTATDVQYSLERMLREPRAAFTYFYSSIDGVDEFITGKGEHVRGFTVVDQRTIQIRLTRPDPTIVHAFAMAPSGVVPRESVEKWGKNFGRHPVGSGPFMLEEWQPGSDVVLKRNPGYRDAAHVWLDGVEFAPYSNQMTDAMRVQRGKLDMCGVYQADFVRLKGDPKWSRYFTQQLQMSQFFLVTNAQMKPFDDVLVRQALNWAIDRARNAKMQHSPPSYQILPRGMPGYIEGEKFYGYDPAKAKELLMKAGYPDGFKTTITAPGGNPVVSQVAQAVQSDLKDVGIEAKIELIPAATYFARLAQPKTVALAPSGWAMDFPDPYAWIKPLFSKSAAVENGTNWSFWWDPQVEEMLTDAQATLDPSERIAKFSEIQKAISDGAPIVPLTQGFGGVLRSPAVGGFYNHPVYNYDPEHYWRQPAASQ